MPVWQKVCSGLLLPFLVVFLCLANFAMSDELSFTPSLETKEEFTDNLFYTTQKKADLISIFSPGFDAGGGTERVTYDLLGVIDRRLYEQNPELDDWDYHWDGKINYQLTPNLIAFTEATYRKDSSPGQFLETTGVLLTTTEPTYTNTYTLGENYNLSEKTAIGLAYGVLRVTYNYPAYSDYDGNFANLSLNHDLGDLFSSTIGRINLGYSHYRFNDPETSLYLLPPQSGLYRPRNSMADMYSCSIGAQHALSETWSVSLDTGPRYTTSEFDTYSTLLPLFPYVYNIQRKTTKDWSPVGNFSLSYKEEKTSGSLTVSRDIGPAGGSYGITQRITVNLSISQRFTDKLSGSVAVNYFLNKASAQQFSGSAESLNVEDSWISPTIHYDFNNDLGVEFNYNFLWYKNKETNGTLDRNLCFFRLVYKHRFLD